MDAGEFDPSPNFECLQRKVSAVGRFDQMLKERFFNNSRPSMSGIFFDMSRIGTYMIFGQIYGSATLFLFMEREDEFLT